MKAKLAVLAVAVLSIVIAVSSHVLVAQSSQATMDQASAQSTQSTQQNQPKMNEALDHLQQARQALESGSHDKGGHRVKALQLVKQAEAEVQAGIEFDNTHRSGEEKKK